MRAWAESGQPPDHARMEPEQQQMCQRPCQQSSPSGPVDWEEGWKAEGDISSLVVRGCESGAACVGELVAVYAAVFVASSVAVSAAVNVAMTVAVSRVLTGCTLDPQSLLDELHRTA